MTATLLPGRRPSGPSEEPESVCPQPDGGPRDQALGRAGAHGHEHGALRKSHFPRESSPDRQPLTTGDDVQLVRTAAGGLVTHTGTGLMGSAARTAVAAQGTRVMGTAPACISEPWLAGTEKAWPLLVGRRFSHPDVPPGEGALPGHLPPLPQVPLPLGVTVLI